MVTCEKHGRDAVIAQKDIPPLYAVTGVYSYCDTCLAEHLLTVEDVLYAEYKQKSKTHRKINDYSSLPIKVYSELKTLVCPVCAGTDTLIPYHNNESAFGLKCVICETNYSNKLLKGLMKKVATVKGKVFDYLSIKETTLSFLKVKPTKLPTYMKDYLIDLVPTLSINMGGMMRENQSLDTAVILPEEELYLMLTRALFLYSVRFPGYAPTPEAVYRLLGCRKSTAYVLSLIMNDLLKKDGGRDG